MRSSWSRSRLSASALLKDPQVLVQSMVVCVHIGMRCFQRGYNVPSKLQVVKISDHTLLDIPVGICYPLEMVAGLRTLECPMSVMTDSYKAGHFLMYPAAQSMTAYGEFREPMNGMNDNRLVVRNIINLFIISASVLIN